MTDGATQWNALLAAAIVGTERGSAALSATSGAVGELLARVGQGEAEGSLLNAAAVLALYRQAGWAAPLATPGNAEPSEADSAPLCSAAAAGYLARMLGGEFQSVLPEWLAAMAAAGQRMPEVHLPALLDRGAGNTHLRPAVTAVAGRRGRWLAALNPAWVCFVERDPDDVWHTGTAVERRQLLSELRRTDPARARALLSSTWAQERAAERANFLGLLREGLTGADEGILEAALDDRSAEVRTAVATLLVHLPGSAWCERQFARASACMTLSPGPPPRLTVRLPDHVDDVARRDGIGAPIQQGVGQRESWLLQLLESVPPSRWCARWGLTPTQLLAAAGAAEGAWQTALAQGWLGATRTFADADWAEAFAECEPRLGGLPWQCDPGRGRARLLESLRTAFGAGETLPPVLSDIIRAGAPLDAELSLAVPAAVFAILATNPSAAWSWAAGQAESFGCLMAPSVAEDILSTAPEWTPQTKHIQKAVEKLAATLAFRRGMLAAIAAPPGTDAE